MRSVQSAIVLTLTCAAAAAAQSITLGPLACLPTGGNGVVTATVEPAPPADAQLRLYFRRMNAGVQDFYFTPMTKAADGNFWAVFPRPEGVDFDPKSIPSAASDPELASFLEKQATEPAEYYSSLVDASGNELARTPQQRVEVREDCAAPLTPDQNQTADNLTVGDTVASQEGALPFHWECEGIETRIDSESNQSDAGPCFVIAWCRRRRPAASPRSP
jgi:hypothetical protein